jgi:hypothetical protein
MWSHVLVNGDDMAFKCDASFYPIFVQAASDAGFKISQGKQYLSPDWCLINSQVFMRRSGSMKRLGYLNMKLILGESLKTGVSRATPTMIGKDLSKMVQLCPWTNCAVPAALHRWRKDWFGAFVPNWYLPVHLGGFGLDRRFAPKTLRFSRAQREVAAQFVSTPSMALYRLPGMNLPLASVAGSLANWRMVPGPYVQESSESDALDDPWLARLALAYRAYKGSKEVSDRTFLFRFRPQFRLRPMSTEGLERYWFARLFATRLPPCPPLRVLPKLSLQDQFRSALVSWDKWEGSDIVI